MLTCRAFVMADLEAGRLVRVTDATAAIGADYFLVRKRSSSPRKAVDAVWDWCAARLSLP